MPAVSVRGLSKKYRIFPSPGARLKETLTFGRKKYGRDFYALQDIDLVVEPGTALGVLGRNGAGKSTLLGIIAGLLQPTSGTVEANGRVVALSGTGAAFDSELTGRENVMLNGMVLGMKRQEVLRRFDDIAEFADIAEHMDQPLKTFSSGMRSRLGFAVAINMEPDILIMDETLSPGDQVYKDAALQKMYELRDSGTAILLVSHTMKMIEEFCTEAILLHKGSKIAAGETTEVIHHYQALASGIQAQRKNQRKDGGQVPDGNVAGDEEGGASIRSVELLDEHLNPLDTSPPPAPPPVVPHGATVTVRVHVDYLEAVKDSKIAINLRNETQDLKVFSTSTKRKLEGFSLKDIEKDERLRVDFTIKVPLQHSLYTVTATIRGGEESLVLDQAKAIAFRIAEHEEGSSSFQGLVHLPTEIRVFASQGERQGQSATALTTPAPEAETPVTETPTLESPVHGSTSLDPSSTVQTAPDGQEASGGTYTVGSGDTLAGIAAQLGVSVDHLMSQNGISDPDLIYSGQTLLY